MTKQIKELGKIVKNEIVCMELQMKVMDEKEFTKRINTAKAAINEILKLAEKEEDV